MDRDTDPKLLKWFADDMAKSRFETLQTMSGMVMSSNATPYLARIRAPVLGLYPTHGTLTSTEQTGDVGASRKATFSCAGGELRGLD